MLRPLSKLSSGGIAPSSALFSWISRLFSHSLAVARAAWICVFSLALSSSTSTSGKPPAATTMFWYSLWFATRLAKV